MGLERTVEITYSTFDRIFVTVLLSEIFNFIWYENNTTSDVIAHDCSKNFINLKSIRDLTLEYSSLDVKHSQHTCKCNFSYFSLLYAIK